MQILLIEPNYRNKYPPLGLMKLASFHKERGDEVHFFKGTQEQYHAKYGDSNWDRVYISTLFTFHYSKIMDSINIAKKHAKKRDIILGGVAATLLGARFEPTGVNIVSGLLNKPGILNIPGDEEIDKATPDYSILNEIEYQYPLADSYIGYASRGCVNNCSFCAVPILEPIFINYSDIKKWVKGVERKYGEKTNMLLLDNNVLASDKFPDIVADLIELGFGYGATNSSGRRRRVDFNQGLDARRIDKRNSLLLGKIAIDPARVAYDSISLGPIYKEKIRLLSSCGVTRLSNYLLFNYLDKPEDLYIRIKDNIDLNEELGTKIYSFPMKYVPLDALDRKYCSKLWSRKQLRAIQVILNATHGVIGPKREYVEWAFGEDLDDYLTLLWMPEKYIMNRWQNRELALEWKNAYMNLSSIEKNWLFDIIRDNFVNTEKLSVLSSPKIRNIIQHYKSPNTEKKGRKAQSIIDHFTAF